MAPTLKDILKDILTGGGGINTITIVHFYTIHSYVLSVIAIVLSIIHLIALMIQEQEQKGLLLQQLEKLVVSVNKYESIAKSKNASNKV